MDNKTKIDGLLAEFKTHNGRGSLLRANTTLIEIIALLVNSVYGVDPVEAVSEENIDVRLDEVARSWNIPAVEPETPAPVAEVTDAMIATLEMPVPEEAPTPIVEPETVADADTVVEVAEEPPEALEKLEEEPAKDDEKAADVEDVKEEPAEDALPEENSDNKPAAKKAAPKKGNK